MDLNTAYLVFIDGNNQFINNIGNSNGGCLTTFTYNSNPVIV